MPEWCDGTISSGLDGREWPYRVLLPIEYGRTGKRFHTLYLLHGLFGSFENWTELGGLGPIDDLVIVMPEGRDGWYCDGENPADRHESRIVNELLPEIDQKFLTVSSRAGRGIAGNSMGGYGAIKIALKYGDLFSFAGSFSGAFEAPSWSDQFPPANWEEYRPSISRVFGDEGSTTRIENDLYKIVAESDTDDLPEIYFDCGLNDGFLAANRELSRLMMERDMPHRFEVLPGGHDWDYWTGRIEKLTRSKDWRLEKD
ncbi:MAG: alpha/beta hydrolase [Pyrinomonadaceae bacterium]